MMRETKTNRKAPGKSHRKGITLLQLSEMFPTEESARQWFESILWPDGVRTCPRCDSENMHECSHAKMPYRCRDCRKYFSVKTGTLMAGSPLSLRKWVYAIYLDVTSLKGISSMKLHRDIGVTQKTAWFMLQRIREAFAFEFSGLFSGPVEVDEAAFGGKARNMHANKRRELNGRGSVDKTLVAGIKDRESNRVQARVVPDTKSETMSRFIMEHVDPDEAMIYSDGAVTYSVLPNHEAVKHSVGEYVRGMAHTNGIESFWAMLKRAYTGTFHKISPKHLQRYVNEFSGRHNIRNLDTLQQMELLVAQMIGRRLMYKDLIS